ncbi:hypothetical protein Tco_1119362 [Tanacetum coccineum]
MKGKSADTNFEKQSILGKPPLQPIRNQTVIRQPIAYKSEQYHIAKHRSASQVDMSNNLTKPVTAHYLPKEREYAFAKSYHVIASSKSRNSLKNMPRFSSNEMVLTGKIFTSSTTTVDSEPPHGSNTDITNLHECIQNLDSSAEGKNQGVDKRKCDIWETKVTWENFDTRDIC